MARPCLALQQETGAAAAAVAGFWPSSARRATTVEIQRAFN
jgi:hypothetical protein